MRGFIEIPGNTNPYSRLLRPIGNHFQSGGAQAAESPDFSTLHAHFDTLSVLEAAREAKPKPERPRMPKNDAGPSCQQSPKSSGGKPRFCQFVGNVRMK